MLDTGDCRIFAPGKQNLKSVKHSLFWHISRIILWALLSVELAWFELFASLGTKILQTPVEVHACVLLYRAPRPFKL